MIENLMRAVPDTSLFAIFRHDPVTSKTTFAALSSAMPICYSQSDDSNVPHGIDVTIALPT
ncbi:MAG: hypothetical protein RBU24_15440, partial [Kiritimatiellia bacterium]|jgi:hypothetical protein|nr:hypothetical protein [Kiritimatiellia bacterium]